MLNTVSGAAFAIVLLLSSLAEAQTASPSPGTAVEQELIALDKQFDAARQRGDTSFVSDVLTDDFVQISPTGLRTKAELLKAMASAKPTPPGLDELPAPTYTVRVHGETAIMTHVTLATDPHDPATGLGVMHVFLKQQGRWKMAGWSSVPAAPATEHSINSAAYALMQTGKSTEAIELFKLNVRLYPESWNVYDSLGEGYAGAGEKALAIQNYEKSMQLNPKNENGKVALAKLQGK